MQEINKEILIFLNSLLDYEIIEKIATIFADFPIFLVPLFLIIAWTFYSEKSIKQEISSGKLKEKKSDLLFIFYSCVIAIIINLIIQHFVQFDRPESVLEGVGKLIFKHIPDASFPSDHATVSIAFLTSLFFAGYKKIGYILLVPILLMLVSRVILGVHWPFDILAGIIVGVVASIISFKFLKKLRCTQILNNLLIKIASFIKL